MPIVKATEETISQASEALARGELVAFPTETVYGLGADARNGRAVARIFEVKHRPRFNPLIVHVAGLAAAQEIAVFNRLALRAAERFWPGALTLVLPKQAECGVSDLVSAGLETTGLRVPSHPIAQRLIEKSGLAIAAPSANLSGHVSPTSAAHVAADLEDDSILILDGGPATLGLESTVLGFEGDDVCLLRPGSISRTEIEGAMGVTLRYRCADNSAITSPGQLVSHYAPVTGLRLDAEEAEPGEVLLAFGPKVAAHSGLMLNLSETGDLKEAAANLFAALRKLDASEARRIAVMPIPDEGLGEAINDRLRHAAAPR